jgi:PadR family transcriptional regulator, regulatory protein PadR
MYLDVFIYIVCPIHIMGRDGGEYCCDMRGMLGFLILFLLSKQSMHGQELADEISKRKGEKPSPGTIYPALKSLRELGFISEEKEGKTIVYNLTDRGKVALRNAKRRFARTFLGIFP